MLRDIQTELWLLVKRPSTWVLLAVWLLMSQVFAYIFPYVSYLNDSTSTASGGSPLLPTLLPDQMVSALVNGFAFYGGTIALILGVLTFGSEFGWNMWKTLFTQRPGREHIFLAKATAMGIVLLPFGLLEFALGGVASTIIATIENQTIAAPSFVRLAEAIGSGWLIMMVWASIGMLLAVITRGTSLAIGFGIIYALVIEGMISAFANSISWLKPIVEGFLRANSYSLIQPISGTTGSVSNGPGSFSGPFVDPLQAFLVLAGYMVIAMIASMWLMRRRDIA
jgi:ABC-type transport system involved in multi-copper enzyme maturation permease subunit